MIVKQLDKKRYKRACRILSEKADDYTFTWEDAWIMAGENLEQWINDK